MAKRDWRMHRERIWNDLKSISLGCWLMKWCCLLRTLPSVLSSWWLYLWFEWGQEIDVYYICKQDGTKLARLGDDLPVLWSWEAWDQPDLTRWFIRGMNVGQSTTTSKETEDEISCPNARCGSTTSNSNDVRTTEWRFVERVKWGLTKLSTNEGGRCT